MLAWVHASLDPPPILFDSGSRLKVLTGLQKLYASNVMSFDVKYKKAFFLFFLLFFKNGS